MDKHLPRMVVQGGLNDANVIVSDDQTGKYFQPSFNNTSSNGDLASFAFVQPFKA